MPARTNEFQRLIAVIQSHMDPGATVSESAMLNDRETGSRREVDVYVSGTVGGQCVGVSIECSDRSRVADVTWIDAMQAKHSRLETNVLVLVSHSGFTAEAKSVAILRGIRCLTLTDVDPQAPERLFPNVDSLSGKAWALTIDHVTISVGPQGELPAEDVRVVPDTAVFLNDGTAVGSAADVVSALVRSHVLNGRLAIEAMPEHVWAEFGMNPLPVVEGRRLCLRKESPLVLRPIDKLHVSASCKVTIDKFPLRHGRLGAVRVAWGKGKMLGMTRMVVVTDALGGTKLTIVPDADDTTKVTRSRRHTGTRRRRKKG